MTWQRLAGSFTLSVVSLIAIAGAVAAQDSASGVWSGAMEVQGQSVEIVVTLQQAAGDSWTGMIDIPGQNLTSFPLTEIAIAGGAVTFAMQGIPGNPVFVGTWDSEAQTITGDLEQGGQTFPFSLDRTADAPGSSAQPMDPAVAARAVGTWSGTLSAGTQTLRLVFHIEADADGALTATMDSPDQGQTGMPVNTVSFDGTTLRADLTYAGAYFEGALSSDGAALDGSWNQGGATLPLRLEKQ